MASYKLVYFGIPGGGQTSRVALALSGAKWENEYVNQETWPAVKESGRAPFKQVPFLEVTEPDGKKYSIAQGHAIVRFIANRHGFAGDTDIDRAKSDSMIERLSDLRGSFTKDVVWNLPEDEKKVKAKEWAANNWAPFSASLDSFLQESGNGYLVSGKISGADVVWWCTMYYYVIPLAGVELTELQKKFMETVEAVPQIKAFLDSDKNPGKK